MAAGERTKEALPTIHGPRLAFHPLIEERFGIDRTQWKALVEAIFPTATSIESIVLALSYCQARRLDPFKRNVHIVPIWNKQLGCLVDTVWPGIGELRTTAFRTGEYAGRGATVFGPDVTKKIGSVEVTFPEWAQVTVYRIVKAQRVEFHGPRVYWLETYATAKRNDDTPNEMWLTRTRGQIEKCAEAAALRAAFPEEVGGDCIPEEIQNQRAAQAIPRQAVTLDSLADKLSESRVEELPYVPLKSIESEASGELPHTSPRREVAASPRKGKASAARERGYQPETAPDQFERENLDADPPPERKRNGEIFDNQQDAVEAGQ